MIKSITFTLGFILLSYAVKYALIGTTLDSGIYYIFAKALLSLPFTVYFYKLYRKIKLKHTIIDSSYTRYYILLLSVLLFYFVLPLRTIPRIEPSLSGAYITAFSTLALVSLEEYIFRGYLLNHLRKKYPVKKAQAYSSLIFALAHIGNILSYPQVFITINQIIIAFGYGMVLSSVYIKHRSVLLCIAIHFCVNYLQELMLTGRPIRQATLVFNEISFDLGPEILFSVCVSGILVWLSTTIFGHELKSP